MVLFLVLFSLWNMVMRVMELFFVKEDGDIVASRTVGKFPWNYGQQSVTNFRQMRTRLCSGARKKFLGERKDADLLCAERGEYGPILIVRVGECIHDLQSRLLVDSLGLPHEN